MTVTRSSHTFGSGLNSTNLIEGTFDETRRCAKVIGWMPSEASCLSLVWAVLDRASTGRRGLHYTPAISRHIAGICHQLLRTELPQTWDATDTVTEGS